MSLDGASDHSSAAGDLLDPPYDQPEIDGFAKEYTSYEMTVTPAYGDSVPFVLDEKTAPSYGKLEMKSYQMADAELKRIQAPVMQVLKECKPRTWKEIIGILAEDPALKITGSAVKCSPASFSMEWNWRVRWSGLPDAEQEHKVGDWFRGLVRHQEVLDISKDIQTQLAQIVAKQGAVAMSSFMTFLHHAEDTSHTVLHIGIIRVPEIANMRYIVYRIHLQAWAKCEAYGPLQWDASGIDGECNFQEIHPSDEVLKEILPKLEEQAAADILDVMTMKGTMHGAQ